MVGVAAATRSLWVRGADQPWVASELGRVEQGGYVDTSERRRGRDWSAMSEMLEMSAGKQERQRKRQRVGLPADAGVGGVGYLRGGCSGSGSGCEAPARRVSDCDQYDGRRRGI